MAATYGPGRYFLQVRALECRELRACLTACGRLIGTVHSGLNMVADNTFTDGTPDLIGGLYRLSITMADDSLELLGRIKQKGLDRLFSTVD